jgi:hypothetical protein
MKSSRQAWLRGEPLELRDELPHPIRTAGRFTMAGVERAHLGRISRLAPSEIDAEHGAGLPRGNWVGPGATIVGAVFHRDELRALHLCFVLDPGEQANDMMSSSPHSTEGLDSANTYPNATWERRKMATRRKS